jgi:hypothetical protein
MIVAPLQKLSAKHLAMRRMVSGGSMFFIDDEKWQKERPTEKIRLPRFEHTGDGNRLPAKNPQSQTGVTMRPGSGFTKGKSR